MDKYDHSPDALKHYYLGLGLIRQPRPIIEPTNRILPDSRRSHEKIINEIRNLQPERLPDLLASVNSLPELDNRSVEVRIEWLFRLLKDCPIVRTPYSSEIETFLDKPISPVIDNLAHRRFAETVINQTEKIPTEVYSIWRAIVGTNNPDDEDWLLSYFAYDYSLSFIDGSSTTIRVMVTFGEACLIPDIAVLPQ